MHSCYTAAKFVGGVDGKNLPVERCFSKSAQIGPLTTQLHSKQMELQKETRLGRIVNKLPIVIVKRIESKEAMCNK